MKNLNPFLLYYLFVSLLAELALFYSFRSVMSVADYVSFLFVWFVFLLFVRVIFNKLISQNYQKMLVLACVTITTFAYYNIFLIGSGLHISQQGSELGALIFLALTSVLIIRAIKNRLSHPTVIFVVGLTAITTAALPFSLALGNAPVSQGIRQTQLDNNQTSVAYDYSNYIGKVEFESTPDIYLIGMSATTSEAILRKHVGTSSSSFISFLQTNNFRVFRNVFTEAQLTRNSYDLLLSMHRDYYRSIEKIDHGTLASGNIPSPLFDIFRGNGYEINVLSETAKLGIKGANIDHYELTEAPSICNFHFVANSIKRRGFLGGCRIRKVLNRYFNASNEEIVEFHVSKIRTIVNRDKPQMVFMHLRPPFHYRDQKFDKITIDKVKEFRNSYEISLEQAAVNLSKLMEVIHGSERDTIVLVFGDHGLSISREPDNKEPSIFFVQDRYAVLGSVFPRDICSNYFPSEGSYDLVTTLELTRYLVKCLSGGQDPYLTPHLHQAIWNDHEFGFEPYIYE